MIPTTTQFHRSCSECGAALAEDAPQGLCPACLMRQALQPTEAPGLATRLSQAPSREAVAAAFPHLEVIELIGHGGMGAVFRARQPNLGRLVALKVIPADAGGGTDAFAERFEREGRLLARLHHPNIVTIFDSGRAGGFFYLLMEHVDGVNLRQAMRAGRFTPAQALGIVPKICDALQYAHDEGVLHRDIKPENILLDARGRVKLADFGIAKLASAAEVAPECAVPEGGSAEPSPLTQAGMALGTPRYMAPEQAADPQSVDHRADIYSLGVVFYEMLTGELPPGNPVRPSARAEVDQRVDAIVQQALERERDLRQRSAGEMKTQIEAVESAEVRGPKRVIRGFGEVLRHRWLREAAVAMVVAGLLWTFCVRVYRIKTDAAAPELASGSWVVVWMLPWRLAPGDLVVYKEGKHHFVGRVESAREAQVVVSRFGQAGHVMTRDAVTGKVVAQTRAGSPAAGQVTDVELTLARKEYADAEQRHQAGLIGKLPLARARYRMEVAEARGDALKTAEARVRWTRTQEGVTKTHHEAGTLAALDAIKAEHERVSAEAEYEELKRRLSVTDEARPAALVPMEAWIQGTWEYDAEHSREQARVADSANGEEVRRTAEEVLRQIKATMGKGSEQMKWTYTPTHIKTHHHPGGPRSDPYTIVGRPGSDVMRVRTVDEGREKILVVHREGERMRLEDEPPRQQVPHLELPAYFRRVAEEGLTNDGP